MDVFDDADAGAGPYLSRVFFWPGVVTARAIGQREKVHHGVRFDSPERLILSTARILFPHPKAIWPDDHHTTGTW